MSFDEIKPYVIMLLLIGVAFQFGRMTENDATYEQRIENMKNIIRLDSINDQLLLENTQISHEKTLLRIEKAKGWNNIDSIVDVIKNTKIDSNNVRTDAEANNALDRRLGDDRPR